jgi:broad specificity phosphatase PhoE
MTDRFADLLRHGEPVGGGRFRSASDDPLTPAGASAMAAAVASAWTSAGAGWDRVLSSPALRCAGFAADLARDLALPLEVWPDLAERGWGVWEGLAAEQIPAADLARFWADPAGFTPTGAEPLAEFHRRIRSAWGRVLTGPARHPLVVTHGGAVRAILGAVLDLPDSALILIEVPYACLTRLRLPDAPGRPSLMAHGPCSGPGSWKTP